MNEPQPMGPRSAAAVARLSRIPRFLLIIGVVALFAAGLLLPGAPGALLLVPVIVLAAWLAALTWGSQPVPLRAVRLLVIGALAAAAASKLL